MTSDEFQTVKDLSQTLARLSDEQLIFLTKLVTQEANMRADRIRNPRVKLRLVENKPENKNNAHRPTE